MATIIICIAIVWLWQGCGNDDIDPWNLGDINSTGNAPKKVSSPAFYRYQGNYEPMQADIQPYMSHMQHQRTVLTGQVLDTDQLSLPFGGAPLPKIDPRQLDNLQTSASRINDKREDLKRVLSELDMEQRQYQSDLHVVNSSYERNKQLIMEEYSRYIQSLRSMAAIQVNYPRDQVYVNAYKSSTVPSVVSTELAPFTIPTIQIPQISDTKTTDYSEYKASLISFIDNCLIICKASTSPSKSIITELELIKSQVSSSSGSASFLADTATKVNSLLVQINKLPRAAAMSEVWVDPQSVSAREDQVKLDQLVVQEAQSKVALGAFTSQTTSTIPDLFSLTQTQNSRNHKMKIFRDRKSHQIKIIATCFYKQFVTHRGERFFLSFTCEDTHNSFSALADPGKKNFLSESVLKVICHSKDFAKKIVLDSRTTRCSISQWASIAEGVSAKFKRTDRQGKQAWNALKNGTGCFSKTESEISARCRNSSRKKSRKDKE